MSIRLAQKNKFWYLHPSYKKNKRFRCTDCGAQFWDLTEADKMEQHSTRTGWRHIGLIVATAPRGEGEFYTLSDSTDYWRRVYKENLPG